MCTTFVLPTSAGTFAGRNLDLDMHFGERVVLTPRNVPITFRNSVTVSTHDALLGMATVAQDYPLYAEAVNESGLYMAGLYFPRSAHYVARETLQSADHAQTSSNMSNNGSGSDSIGDGDGSASASGLVGVASFELITYTLTQAHNVEQARELLSHCAITDEVFAPQMPAAPLHFFCADRTGAAIVIEQTADRIAIYDNPAHALTNNPPFPFQLEHLRYFMGLNTVAPANTFTAKASDALTLTPNGEGFGQLGLPGDSTPASRFIRAAFQVQHSSAVSTRQEAVTQVLHLLDSVLMVKGSTINAHGREEYTMYSAALDLEHFAYYVTTYENRRIMAVEPQSAALDGNQLVQFALQSEPDFDKLGN